MQCGILVTVVLGVIGFASGTVRAQIAPEELEKITAALPDKATVEPAQPRKLLVFDLCTGSRHGSIPYAAAALKMLGSRTGAYKAVVSEDIALFHPENLKQFDAVCFNNTVGELFDDPALKQSLMDFVKSGKGVVGIHAATDCFHKWPEYGEMMGGYFHGHPWHEKVTVKIDDPDHPLTSVFKGQPFEIVEEIYQFQAPYSRDHLRVLLSLDTGKTDMNKQGIHRTDGDFAVSWVRSYGKGRVFYCSLGHRNEIFWNPVILQHYLDGIQFALGDLPADTTPSTKSSAKPGARPAGPGWIRLFNGKDLTGRRRILSSP